MESEVVGEVPEAAGGVCRVNGRFYTWEFAWSDLRNGELLIAARESSLRLRVPAWCHQMVGNRRVPGALGEFEPVFVYHTRFQAMEVVEAGDGLFPMPVEAGARLSLRPKVACVVGREVTRAGVERLMQWCASGRVRWEGREKQTHPRVDGGGRRMGLE